MSARVVAKLVLKLILCQRRLTQPIKVEDSYIKKIKVTCLQNSFRKNSCSLENLSLLKVMVMRTCRFIEFNYFRSFFYSNTYFVLILLKSNEQNFKINFFLINVLKFFIYLKYLRECLICL